MRFTCVDCAHSMDSNGLAPTCERCGGAVMLSGEGHSSREELEGSPPGVWRYRGFLPVPLSHGVVSLGEGGTPLLHAERLGSELGLRNLLIKDETRNPTGSFMDRGTTVLLSVAMGTGIRECGCDTTGNLGASLAAYCAKAGVMARIRVNPNTDQGKLYQMLAYGAEVEPASGRSRGGAVQITAANPYLLEGEKTTGFEIVQDLGWSLPDAIAVPVGTGGHLSMIHRSLAELKGAGIMKRSACKLIGIQLKASKGPLPSGFPLAELSESEPFFREEAARAIDESGGLWIDTPSDGAISATGLLAKTEGIFAEPSAASVVAGLAKAVKDRELGPSETVVCVITGAGLKDPRAISRVAREARRVPSAPTYMSPSPKIGETKLAILRMLKRPSYAYELWRTLNEAKSISTASIYQHLLELEAFSLVRKRGGRMVGGRERIFYELTKKGGDYIRIAERLEVSGPAA